MAETWLRVVSYETAKLHDVGALEYLAAGVQGVYERLNRHAGFRVGHWGYDPESGVVADITQWADRAAIALAARDLAEVRADRRDHGVLVTSQTNLRILPTPWAPDAEDWAALTVGTRARGLRVVLYRTDPARGHAPLGYLRDSTPATAAMLRRQPGFRLGYWAHAPADASMAAVTFWDDRDAIAQASGPLRSLHDERAGSGLALDRVLNLQLFSEASRPSWERELRRLELLMTGRPSA